MIKARLKTEGVNDVKSMSLFPLIEVCSDKYLIAVLNSTFISEYDFCFVNGTQTFQMNDARQIPIIIPTAKQKKMFEDIFDEAYSIKEKQFDGKLSEEAAEKKLAAIQTRLDAEVLSLYGLTEEAAIPVAKTSDESIKDSLAKARSV